MKEIYEHTELKKKIEEKRQRLYKLLELETNENLILELSQELDLLINRYNKEVKNQQ